MKLYAFLIIAPPFGDTDVKPDRAKDKPRGEWNFKYIGTKYL